jgi:Tol biopolymer transport system component
VGAALWWGGRRSAEAPDTPRPIARPQRVTARQGVDTWPALSPDGRAVAYVSDRTGSFEIYVAGMATGSREIVITSDGGQNVQPDWSPDGQWIAFHSRVRRGVWMVRSTGGAARQLVEFGSSPAWSPDGQRLAFTSDAGGMASQSTIWSVSRDGGDLRQLTQLGQPPGGHREPAWSIDGKAILFGVSTGRWSQEIWTMPVAGGAPRRLAAPRLGGFLPRFAADGRAIYYGSATGDTGGTLTRQALDPAGNAAGPPTAFLALEGWLEGLSVNREGAMAFAVTRTDINLWSVEVGEGGDPRSEPVRLTQDVVRNARPDVGKDGRVLYVQYGPGRPMMSWWMDGDGGNVEPLVSETWVGEPQWTRDGRVLVRRDAGEESAFWWVDPRTRRMTRAGASTENVSSARPSPDGREIAFHVIDPSGVMNVWAEPAEGGARRRVTSDAEAVSYPAWSPDGRWLAVEIKRGDQTHIGVVSKDGGPVTQLTSDPGQSWPNSFSPDGERIAFAAERGGVWNVYAVARTTKKVTQVTRFTSPGGYVRYPSWSPRGDRIVFERCIRESSVWRLAAGS